MQDIRIVSFNVNGILTPIKRGKILSKLKKDKVQIAYLQESHLNDIADYSTFQIGPKKWASNTYIHLPTNRGRAPD